jgi:hypothetical protein
MRYDDVGTVVIVNTPWWGVGAMLSAAASWLPYGTGLTYAHCSNTIYPDPHKDYPPNQFEWFFEPQVLPRHFNVVLNRHPSLPINTAQTPDTINKLRHLINLHWRIKPHLIDRSAVIDPATTLAVHYRGTDKFLEVPLTPTECLRHQIDAALMRLNLKHVLICTDDQNVLDELLVYYPQAIIFAEHLRGSGHIGLHHLKGSYRQAMETYREVLVMGLCKHFICGRSCVSDLVLLLARNPLLTWEYHN